MYGNMVKPKKNTFTGTKNHDIAYATKANETFNLKKGYDTIVFDVTGSKKIGTNTVVLNKQEGLTLSFVGDEAGDTIIPEISKSGEVVLTVKRGDKTLGKINLKGSNGDKIPYYLRIESENYNITAVDFYNQNAAFPVTTIDKSSAKKGQTIKGTFLYENIIGSSKADTIYTNFGKDTVTGGKGNDKIILNGEGDKTIIINKGDGNDTLTPSEYTEDYKTNVIFTAEEPINFTYEKKGMDFTIKANYADSTSDSIKLKKYALLDITDSYEVTRDEYEVGKPIVSGLTVNGEEIPLDINVDVKSSNALKLAYSILEAEGISKKQINTILKQYKVTIPAFIKNINAFLGTGYNDTVVSTNKKGIDVMLSLGGDENSYTTSSKTKSVILSITPDSDDNYEVSSFNAGSIIVDSGSKTDGGDKLTVKGVNVNDLHLGTTSGLFTLGGGDKLSDLVEDYAATGIYLTDTKGVNNLAGIDYKGIYSSVMKKISAMQKATTVKQSTNAVSSLINYALKTVPSIINQFRGVVVGVGKNKKEIAKDTYQTYKTMIDNNIKVVDKNGVEQYVTAENIEKYNQVMTDKVAAYIDNVDDKYNLKLHEKYGDSEIINKLPTAYGKKVAEFGAYLLAGPDTKGMSKKQKTAAQTAYKNIKAGFFKIFNNMYMGTDGSNSYTIDKSKAGAIFLSDDGNDLFTFKGALAKKNSTAEYTILSHFDKTKPTECDIIQFANHSFDDFTLRATLTDFNTDMAESENFSMGFRASDYKNQAYADVQYGLDFRASEGVFDGTKFTSENQIKIIDGSQTMYDVCVNSNYAGADWTATAAESNKNHYGIYAGDNITITSNDKKNVVLANATGELKYNYNGGSDIVYSIGDSSYDTYNVALGEAVILDNVKLIVADDGEDDWDKIAITGEDSDLSNMRLFFNVDKKGVASDVINIVSNNNLKKANFILIKTENTQNILADKGIKFVNNIVSDNDHGIEEVRFGGKTVDIANAVNEITESVQAWLGAHKKYTDVYDVLSKGSKSDVNAILAQFNKEVELKPAIL